MTGIELIQAGPQVQEMYATMHPQPDLGRDWEPFLVIAVFDGVTIMGYAAHLLLSFPAIPGEILQAVEVIVRPEYQGRGLGKLLKRAQIALAEELGVVCIVAGCDDNQEAMKHLYDSFGFVKWPEGPEALLGRPGASLYRRDMSNV